MTEANATPAFLIVAKYVLDPADVDPFKAITARMAEGAQQRTGNIFLNAAQDLADPAVFHLTEGWASQEAADEHFQSEQFQCVLKDALQLRVVERSGTIYFVSGMQSLEMPS